MTRQRTQLKHRLQREDLTREQSAPEDGWALPEIWASENTAVPFLWDLKTEGITKGNQLIEAGFPRVSLHKAWGCLPLCLESFLFMFLVLTYRGVTPRFQLVLEIVPDAWLAVAKRPYEHVDIHICAKAIRVSELCKVFVYTLQSRASTSLVITRHICVRAPTHGWLESAPAPGPLWNAC